MTRERRSEPATLQGSASDPSPCQGVHAAGGASQRLTPPQQRASCQLLCHLGTRGAMVAKSRSCDSSSTRTSQGCRVPPRCSRRTSQGRRVPPRCSRSRWTGVTGVGPGSKTLIGTLMMGLCQETSTLVCLCDVLGAWPSHAARHRTTAPLPTCCATPPSSCSLSTPASAKMPESRRRSARARSTRPRSAIPTAPHAVLWRRRQRCCFAPRLRAAYLRKSLSAAASVSVRTK